MKVFVFPTLESLGISQKKKSLVFQQLQANQTVQWIDRCAKEISENVQLFDIFIDVRIAVLFCGANDSISSR